MSNQWGPPQTRGQNLEYHPHIHCIFVGDVWREETSEWVESRPDYLFPAAVVKSLFKGKLLAFFQEAVKSGDIGFHGQLEQYQDEKMFKKLLSTLYDTDPVVYLKEPFASPEQLIQYLGNYTHRVAISQRRSLSVENGSVSFSYKDNADNNTQKVMTVSIVEFIRRFLLHVLPSRFMRIRHCGFLSNRRKKKLVQSIRQSMADHSQRSPTTQQGCTSIIERVRAELLLLCPHCKQGRLNPRSQIPPLWKLVAA
ncbi:MAG: transposase [Syntrophaceae bacterium]|nr:transposase [Syntrophaceae bacterium]